MIVRILGEGQFRVDADVAAKLTALDKELDAAVAKHDDSRVPRCSRRGGGLVRASGTPVRLRSS